MTREVPPDVHFRSARRSLISTLEAYGVDPRQAEIQVDNLVEAARNFPDDDSARGVAQ